MLAIGIGKISCSWYSNEINCVNLLHTIIRAQFPYMAEEMSKELEITLQFDLSLKRQVILTMPIIRTGLKPIGPRSGIIHSQLFKYTQQHTACFTENNWAPHLLRPVMSCPLHIHLLVEIKTSTYMSTSSPSYNHVLILIFGKFVYVMNIQI